MREWSTSLEVARRLNVSKEVVKYHRKKLDFDKVREHDGVFYISEEGVKEIASRLTKTSYTDNFEHRVLERLAAIEYEIKILRTLRSEENKINLNKQLEDYSRSELEWLYEVIGDYLFR